MARSTKPKLKVQQPNLPHNNVKNNIKAEAANAQVWFDFQNTKWLSSIKTKKFTNFLDSSEECLGNYYKILYEVIPKVQAEWNNIIGRRQGYPHCHLLTNEKATIARKIYYEIYKHQLDEGVAIWQFGFTGSTRLMCIHNSSKNALVPIFVDHHHHVYDDKNYNQRDFDRFSFCMICNNK